MKTGSREYTKMPARRAPERHAKHRGALAAAGFTTAALLAAGAFLIAKSAPDAAPENEQPSQDLASVEAAVNVPSATRIATPAKRVPVPRAARPAAVAKAAAVSIPALPAAHYGEPMLDRDELKRPPLDLSGFFSPFKAAIVREVNEKRGLRTAYLIPQESKSVTSAVPTVTLVAPAAPAATAATAAPIVMGPDGTSEQGCVGPLAKFQFAQVGCVRTYSNGMRMTLLAFDGSKPYGSRHKYKWESPGAAAVEYDISPLVFDLNGDGVRMSRRSVSFDARGVRRKAAVNDISAADGLLVLGAAEGGLAAFGTATDLDGDGKPDGYADGFAALRALVEKARRDRVLDASFDGRTLSRADLSSLAKSYGLGMRLGGAAGRIVTLEQAGVRSIALPDGACSRVKNFDGQGNETMRCAGAVFARADGRPAAYEDVWFEL